MTTTSGDVAQTQKKISMAKRNVAPSGGSVQEAMLDFLVDIDTDFLSLADIETLETLFDDLECLNNIAINEALHFSKKSTTGARITARKWYKQNKGRVQKLQSRLKKSKGIQKKKEIMAKSGRTLTKKKRRKYNTKNHVTEAINGRIAIGAKELVDRMFENTPYRVIRSFTIDGDVEAKLNEKIEHVCGGTWILTKRNGNRYRLSVTDNEYITPYIKHENNITVEDFI